MTPEELVARGDAPVKPEFVRRTGRVFVDAVGGGGGAAAGGKKSRNQIKKVGARRLAGRGGGAWRGAE